MKLLEGRGHRATNNQIRSDALSESGVLRRQSKSHWMGDTSACSDVDGDDD